MYSALLLTFVAGAFAACDNHCSGHGTCNTEDVCDCYDNWGVGLSHDSGDCSERTCPFEIAWVDTPDLDGNFHKYLECSGRGICQRDAGECACFDGYEGKGCQRSTCPNDCSGHGTCEYIEDLAYGNVWSDYSATGLYESPATFAYRDWDQEKERTCVCDPHFGGADCSKRMCPYGNDILDARDNQVIVVKKQIQRISFFFPVTRSSDIDTKTFALSFKTKLGETYTTVPIVFDYDAGADFANDVQLALLNLPNRVVDGVTVQITRQSISPPEFDIDVAFTGNAVQGNQNLLIVHTYQCLDGCTPKITGLPVETRSLSDPRGHTPLATYNIGGVTQHQSADYNSFECGRRGKCDYDTGLCGCFSGYTGENCNTLHALF